jgi:hypothetical protein
MKLLLLLLFVYCREKREGREKLDKNKNNIDNNIAKTSRLCWSDNRYNDKNDNTCFFDHSPVIYNFFNK